MRLAAPAKCFVILIFTLLIGCALWWSLGPMHRTPSVRIVGCFYQGESALQPVMILSLPPGHANVHSVCQRVW